MRILIVSDEEDRYLWDYYRPGCLRDADLILSAGDLKAEYLSFLVTVANRPLLYVHGNHDGSYDHAPPEGCDCIDDRLFTVNGLRILGLGGCMRYNHGPYQYSERQMSRRIRRLQLKLYRAGGVDIVLTHAPAEGYGDQDDLTHRGFAAFLPLMDRWHPRYLIHGHVHQRYAPTQERVLRYGETTIINANGKYFLDI
ncbi:MAG: metallophosphoesterase family protein [Oscillospiraceae bacterium]|nr:metallophosphoesterase family protein [Oscillospiraceae bacterium]